MAKDFTDYILFICDAGERVYHIEHKRSFNGKDVKGEEYEKHPYELNNHKYQLNLDRAYRIRWAPWKKIIRFPHYKVPIKAEWYFGTIKKGTDDKIRVLYEKIPVLITKTKKPIFSLNVYATLKELFRAKKIGIIFYQEPCTHDCSTCPHKLDVPCPVPLLIEPMHISRIHQPSGEMRG